ncbi:hypothetical protein, partial [Columbia Basin potato purple top phytoplasma]
EETIKQAIIDKNPLLDIIKIQINIIDKTQAEVTSFSPEYKDKVTVTYRYKGSAIIYALINLNIVKSIQDMWYRIRLFRNTSLNKVLQNTQLVRLYDKITISFIIFLLYEIYLYSKIKKINYIYNFQKY